MTKTENIMNIATKRGFFFPAGEIYKPIAGFWTYGHLGTLMKHNWENLWRKYFLGLSTNYFEIEDVNIMHKAVFQSSGHLDNFNDPLTECKKCHFRCRADQLIEDALERSTDGLKEKEMEELIKKNKIKCPNCNSSDFDKVVWFNMMFDLKVGATGNETVYLRPETAQSPYIAFKREFSALREKLPMGLAVIGKAFRNEISPRQGFFRLREFTQAELQIFFDPENIDKADNWNEVKNYKVRVFLTKDKKINEISCEDLNKKLKLPRFYVYHMTKIQKFYLEVLQIPKDKFRFRELSEAERAFYNKIHFDIELDLETLKGWKEMAGLHFRGDHDLGGHQKGSKEKLEVSIEGKKFIPNVLELSFGVDRNIWALMDIFYKAEKERELFQFDSIISPIQVAIFPLLRKDKLPEKAKEIFETLNKEFICSYDETGSIGKMYRRMDEIGCNAMITIDHQTLKDDSVTLRDRDSLKQIRVKTKNLKEVLKKFLEGERLEKLGKIV
ncbi:glycine--tRNA ligase [Candidatus Woesearchaeota archaeon]|nr:glycine--tRNA ligase [Candidatus Woesearchaeota archaeon]